MHLVIHPLEFFSSCLGTFSEHLPVKELRSPLCKRKCGRLSKPYRAARQKL